MAETVNIAEVAQKLSKDIFKHFRWHMHPLRDVNFDCVSDSHTAGKEGSKKKKASHPTDVVFSYDDPYLGKRVNLLTDLKSYASSTITHIKIRSALASLALAVECASVSEDWREKFIDPKEINEIRGLLFVHNHDKNYGGEFYKGIQRVQTSTLPIARGSTLHYIGPFDIQRLFTIANDIMRLGYQGEISSKYTFYYPDLVMYRRHGDVWDQPATVEALCGPYIIMKDEGSSGLGYVIYYNRSGSTVEEFVYLIDCFSRYQMLDSNEYIRLRIVNPEADGDVKSRFHTASQQYARAWGFDPERVAMLEKIEVERIGAVSDNYDPGDIGWRA